MFNMCVVKYDVVIFIVCGGLDFIVVEIMNLV